MRAAMCFTLALATFPATAHADVRHQSSGGRHLVRHHGLHRTTIPAPFPIGGLYDFDAMPYAEAPALVPIAMPPPPPPPRPCNNRPTVEHTEFGVTIIRGPGSCR